MTQHYIDLKNADVIMIIGSNMAENHPVAFKWVTEAMNDSTKGVNGKQGATLISVDPRFTRTSSKADIYARLRSGTDIAFIGGMIKYALDNGLYNKKYVKECTNALFVINKDFETCREGDLGLFSGAPGTGTPQYFQKYDKSTWQYVTDGSGNPVIAPDLEKRHPDYPDCPTVFELLKKQYEDYTISKVCSITGTDQDVFKEVCETYLATRHDNKSGTICYAMGTTQHTYGTQNIRSYAILQLLLGNIGVAGGGINALRGWSNVQGSTDMNLLMHIIPSYNPCPQAVLADKDMTAYCENRTPKTKEPAHSYTVRGVSKDPESANWWQNRPKYVVSLLKAWWPDVDCYEDPLTGKYICPSYQYLPKRDGDCSWISLFEDMLDGKIKGLICFNQNPAVVGPGSERERKALEKLDWLVVCDLFHTETSDFWERPGVNPENIKTEVFLLPGAAWFEKEGSVSNSGRWVQWRWKACEPPKEKGAVEGALDELEIVRRLGVALKGKITDPQIANLSWNYASPADPAEVAKEINGYNVKTNKLIKSFSLLKNDGTTACGNWLYCGSYIDPDDCDSFEKAHPEMWYGERGNRMARRYNIDVGNLGVENNIGLYSYWSWCWPVNRRIIYNRASTYQSDYPEKGKLAGDPLAPNKAVIWWDGGWKGDVPDHGAAPGGVYPFIMKPEGHARLFGMGLADGPFPEHYEPRESPVPNQMSGQQYSPVVYQYPGTTFANLDPNYPIVCSTYRVSEHWHGGGMTRNLPWLCELMPEAFVEMSEELAESLGIKNGDEVIVSSVRGEITLKACVTKRFKPFMIGGNKVHQVGVIWHFGYRGICTGDSGNVITPVIGDCNTRIPESKAFAVNIRKKT